MSDPLAYFITWTCRGTWLHGDERGSIDREHNAFGTRPVEPDVMRNQLERAGLAHPPVILSESERLTIENAIQATCSIRGWSMHELGVRSNHVHIVISAPKPPERVMQDLKAWSTRALRSLDSVRFAGDVWTRHGSTRYIFDEHSLAAAIEYVRSHETNPRAHARGSL